MFLVVLFKFIPSVYFTLFDIASAGRMGEAVFPL